MKYVLNESGFSREDGATILIDQNLIADYKDNLDLTETYNQKINNFAKLNEINNILPGWGDNFFKDPENGGFFIKNEDDEDFKLVSNNLCSTKSGPFLTYNGKYSIFDYKHSIELGTSTKSIFFKIDNYGDIYYNEIGPDYPGTKIDGIKNKFFILTCAAGCYGRGADTVLLYINLKEVFDKRSGINENYALEIRQTITGSNKNFIIIADDKESFSGPIYSTSEDFNSDDIDAELKEIGISKIFFVKGSTQNYMPSGNITINNYFSELKIPIKSEEYGLNIGKGELEANIPNPPRGDWRYMYSGAIDGYRFDYIDTATNFQNGYSGYASLLGPVYGTGAGAYPSYTLISEEFKIAAGDFYGPYGYQNPSYTGNTERKEKIIQSETVYPIGQGVIFIIGDQYE